MFFSRSLNSSACVQIKELKKKSREWCMLIYILKKEKENKAIDKSDSIKNLTILKHTNWCEANYYKPIQTLPRLPATCRCWFSRHSQHHPVKACCTQQPEMLTFTNYCFWDIFFLRRVWVSQQVFSLLMMHKPCLYKPMSLAYESIFW